MATTYIPITSRSPREVARALSLAWLKLGDTAEATTEELSRRRDTLLALEAAGQDGTRGKFPGTALLLDYQGELATRARRLKQVSVAPTWQRGPYSDCVKQVRDDFNPRKYDRYA